MNIPPRDFSVGDRVSVSYTNASENAKGPSVIAEGIIMQMTDWQMFVKPDNAYHDGYRIAIAYSDLLCHRATVTHVNTQ